ncbi:MAG: sulfite exporter TauE/SafE family protein [Acidobacteria bacterium]|nr:sulfite exporter TauE/SafE family protein [Acidobacteriota bacterium]
MAPAELAIPFGFGLVSSLHCAQMCGPIVLSYSMGGRGGALSHALYNVGRICTYALLGAAAGAAGNAVGLLGRMAGYERIAALIAGALLIAAGIMMSGVLPKSGLVRIERIGLPRLFSRSVGRLLTSSHPGSRLALGLVLGFLPCGLSYAAVLQSLATGSALGGALSMAAFGVGTSASLLAIGMFSSAIGARLGRWNTVLATASVILMGAFLLYRGIMPGPAMTMGRNCHGHS